ncbi:MAG: exodeoxyribonuclease I [Spirochaetales bacterium]
MPFSLLWYDLETFGRHPQWDRIAQFAAIRTNDSFEPIGEPVVAYCKLSPDYVPQPDAALITGITPQTVEASGTNEREFARLIHEQMIVPATCSVGYNNLRFDDEFLRALFYRNFYDPFRREYAEGNSRWDIIDLMRMCHDLRPEGITWVRNEAGVPVFKLEELARANDVEHEQAHDALSDVRATIGLAKLVHTVNHRLFKYYFSLRKKDEVRKRLSLQKMEPLLLTSVLFSCPTGCTSMVLPLSVNPMNANEVIAYDLRRDPSDWLEASVEEIRRRVFTKKEELGPDERIPFVGIQINRSPAISPLATLEADGAARIGLDVESCIAHARLINERTDLVQRIRAVYAERPRTHFHDPDLQIYSGDFFPDEDRQEFEQIRSMSPAALKQNPPALYDRRGPEMLWRYVARNHPEALDEAERERWKSFCASRILTPEAPGAIDIGTFLRDVRNRLSRVDTPAREKVLLKSLLEYGLSLEKAVLT